MKPKYNIEPNFVFDQLFNSLPGSGWLTEAEARLLWDVSSQCSGPILEVGSYYGRSMVLLASHKRPVYCVDPWTEFDSNDPTGELAFSAFIREIIQRNLTNVIPYRMSIEDWPPQPCGFCYLDGDHTYQGTQAQIEKALQCCPDIIAIHDVNDSGGGYEVKQAAVEALGAWEEREERLSVWLLR